MDDGTGFEPCPEAGIIISEDVFEIDKMPSECYYYNAITIFFFIMKIFLKPLETHF